jgi:hypothetical protein
MICKIDGCERNVHARGWCNKHYNCWYNNGDPNVIKFKYEKHGYKNHSLYKIWQNMKTRCYNKNCKEYKWYGGRGIQVCDEWKNSAKIFIEWALPLWKEGLQIDREDNDGNYCPENCRFIMHKENIHNQRLLRENNTSGYCGVSCQRGKWMARISIDEKRKYIGHFDTPEEAAIAYDEAVPDNRPRNFK